MPTSYLLIGSATDLSSTTLNAPTGDWAADTETLQGYFDDAMTNGGMVVIPPGVWNITTPLTLTCTSSDTPGITIQGFGPWQSRLVNMTGGQSIIRVQQESDYKYMSHLNIKDIGFWGTNTDSEDLLRFRGATTSQVENCYFYGAGRYGVFIDYNALDPTASYLVAFRTCSFTNCRERAIWSGEAMGDGASIPHVTVRECRFSGNGGCWGGGISMGCLNNCSFAYSQLYPQVEITQVVSHSSGWNISNCAFEGGRKGELSIGNTYGGIVEGCRFIGTYRSAETPAASFGIAVGKGINQKGMVTTLAGSTVTWDTGFDQLPTVATHGYDLAGLELTVSGMTDPQNNGTFTITSNTVRNIVYENSTVGASTETSASATGITGNDANNVIIRNITFNFGADATLNSFTGIYISPNAAGTMINGITYQSWDTVTPYTKCADWGVNTTRVEAQVQIPPPKATYTDTNFSTNYTPDLVNYHNFRFNITGGPVTINNPIETDSYSQQAGREIDFTFLNNTGGAVDGSTYLLWGSDFAVGSRLSGAGSWPNASWVTFKFRRDVTNGRWFQVGASNFSMT